MSTLETWGWRAVGFFGGWAIIGLVYLVVRWAKGPVTTHFDPANVCPPEEAARRIKHANEYLARDRHRCRQRQLENSPNPYHVSPPQEDWDFEGEESCQ